MHMIPTGEKPVMAICAQRIEKVKSASIGVIACLQTIDL
jgi:hypothetical protein